MHNKQKTIWNRKKSFVMKKTKNIIEFITSFHFFQDKYNQLQLFITSIQSILLPPIKAIYEEICKVFLIYLLLLCWYVSGIHEELNNNSFIHSIHTDEHPFQRIVVSKHLLFLLKVFDLVKKVILDTIKNNHYKNSGFVHEV